MGAPAPAIDPARVEAIAREVLERSEFRDIAIPEPWRFRPPEVSSSVAWVLVIVAGLLLAVAVFFLVRLVRRRLGRSGDEAGAPRHLRDAAERVQTSADALRHAEAFAREEDFREALRFVHLAALLSFAERRMLRFHDSMTNGECARALRSDARRGGVYRRLSERCDGVVFGGVRATREAWQTSRAEFAECVRE